MRTLRLLSVTLALGAAATPALAQDVERTIDVQGATRAYRLHVPAAWDRSQPLPVLFVFHGAGSDAESMVRATGFDALADASPMLVVYPRAPARVGRYDVDPPPDRTSADVLLVDALLARLRERYPVDPRRVWATGFSNGAALCYRLAAERPREIAAIAPVAGYLPRIERPPGALPVPLLHVHGTLDARVAAPSRTGEPGSAVTAWARWNGASEALAPERVPGLSAQRLAFVGATPRADTTLLLVDGVGHVWPGGPAGPVSRAILEFLAAHPSNVAPPPSNTAPPGVTPPAALPAPTPHRLVGQPLGSLAVLRWLTPERAPFALDAQPLTLLRWWTNGCSHCVASLPVLAQLEQRYRARGLRLVGVYHPKGARLSDEAARALASRLGFSGALAFDDRWTKYVELRDRGGLRKATSISVLVDSAGTIRWVHAGPRIESGSRDEAALTDVLERLLPAAPGAGTLPAGAGR